MGVYTYVFVGEKFNSKEQNKLGLRLSWRGGGGVAR